METPDKRKIIDWNEKNTKDESRFDKRAKKQPNTSTDEEPIPTMLDSFYQEVATDKPLLRLRKDDDDQDDDDDNEMFFDITLVDDEKHSKETRRIVEQQNQAAILGLSLDNALNNKSSVTDFSPQNSDSVTNRLINIKNTPDSDIEENKEENIAELILKKSGINPKKNKKS